MTNILKWTTIWGRFKPFTFSSLLFVFVLICSIKYVLQWEKDEKPMVNNTHMWYKIKMVGGWSFYFVWPIDFSAIEVNILHYTATLLYICIIFHLVVDDTNT